MSLKVELGFTSAGASAPFFTLDNPISGLLDSTEWVLGGGEVLVDVSPFVRSAKVTRGKSRELDRFNAGTASVAFNNELRTFDPTFEASPYFGQIRPKRQIKITLDDVLQFEGTVDDWDLQYDQGGMSVAVCNAFDGTQSLANLTLTGFTTSVESTGERIARVLDAVSWPADKRDLDFGTQTLEADTVDDGTNVYEYLQKVTSSEPGDLFISKNGSVKFVDRTTTATSGGLEFADDSTGLPYTNISTVFGTELLLNSVTLSNSTSKVLVTDIDSIALYGEIDYSINTLLVDDTAMSELGNYLLFKYAEPEYRFEAINVSLNDKTELERADLLAVEMGDVVRVTFTPSGIPPAIDRYLKVIKLDVSLEPGNETISFGLESLTGTFLVLDDPEFGKLDAGNALAF